MADTMLRTETHVDPLSEGSKPIADYGLLSDCNTAALVARDGSIDWLCLPRFDSPAVFSALLDPDAGHWSIRPSGEYETRRRYAEGSLVLETELTTPTGTVRLRDALVFPEGQRGHDIGVGAPHELLRSVEGVTGSVDLVLELAPRPEYGLVRPLFRKTDDGGPHVRRPEPGGDSRGCSDRGGGGHHAGRVHGAGRGLDRLLAALDPTRRP
jgi:GH15 family glucan-1,4-alpha-glucosidase